MNKLYPYLLALLFPYWALAQTPKETVDSLLEEYEYVDQLAGELSLAQKEQLIGELMLRLEQADNYFLCSWPLTLNDSLRDFRPEYGLPYDLVWEVPARKIVLMYLIDKLAFDDAIEYYVLKHYEVYAEDSCRSFPAYFQKEGYDYNRASCGMPIADLNITVNEAFLEQLTAVYQAWYLQMKEKGLKELVDQSIKPLDATPYRWCTAEVHEVTERNKVRVYNEFMRKLRSTKD